MSIHPFLEAGLAIQIHMIAAIGAVILGAIVFWRRKGNASHKLNGRIWVALMLVTSLSGFFIHEIRLWGNFSPIHIFSIVVPMSMAWAVYCVRRGNVREHELAMKGTFYGLLVAGAFTLFPTRVPFEMLFGQSWNEYDPPFAWIIPIVVAIGIAALISRRSQTN